MKRSNYIMVFYDEESVKNTVKVLEGKTDFEWCKDFYWGYALHDKDLKPNGENKKSHYHLALQFVKAVESDRLFAVIKSFLPHQSEWDIKGADKGNFAYLIHANAPQKYQYDIGIINTNMDFEDLETTIEEHRKYTKETSMYANMIYINQIMLLNPNIDNVGKLINYCIQNDCKDLLYFISRNVLMVKMTLEGFKIKRKD